MDKRVRALERAVVSGDADAIDELETYANRSGMSSPVLSAERERARRDLAAVLRRRLQERTTVEAVICPGCLCPANLSMSDDTQYWRCLRPQCAPVWGVDVWNDSLLVSDYSSIAIQAAACVAWAIAHEREAGTGPGSDPDAIFLYNGPVNSHQSIDLGPHQRIMRDPISSIPTREEIEQWLLAPRMEEDAARERGDNPRFISWRRVRRLHPVMLKLIAVTSLLVEPHVEHELDSWWRDLRQEAFRDAWDSLPARLAYDDPCDRPVSLSERDYVHGLTTRKYKCDLPQHHKGACMVDPDRDSIGREHCSRPA